MTTPSPQQPPRGPLDRLLALGTLPVAALALTGTLAAYITLVAFGNLTDFGTNREFVRHVLAMDTTFGDKDVMWRAVGSRLLQDLAYVAVIAWEVLAAVVLVTATVLWFRALRSRTEERTPYARYAKYARYERARRATTLGAVMLMLLFGLGFVAVGGEWFSMWQSSKWNGLDAAARNFTLAGFVLLLVHLPSAQWTEREREREQEPEPEQDTVTDVNSRDSARD
ncbi:DUF2165 domain-containing protein [Streptomyces boluensis]|uniref:DUF2165 family protein n=1 Tax=Streptomyces boluensis TaxID=1775135 RepID=A0A964UKP6_9ACTN|nr:DUF2165 domain-containing protein [Streptomyces boluensis]NBE50984.1 DUF2165 family protein [Streptomyces boluensis]